MPEIREILRSQMPVAPDHAYFDHAAVAPLPATAAKRIHDFAEDASHHGDLNWPSWATTVGHLRTLVARLLNCNEREVALVSNTTQGINLVAEGFPWKSGDNVVVPENEFPSNLVPWRNLQRRGVELRLLRVPPSGELDLVSLAELMDSRTRLVSLSWVGFSTGYRVDVAAAAEIVHRRGGLLFLDAIQGLGAFPLDVQASGVDFLAADGHKWLLGPEGAGLLYVREQYLELLEPLMLGWGSLAAGSFDPGAATLKTTAARYEGGSTNMVGMLAFDASLDLLLELGTNLAHSPIAAAILENVSLLEDRLSSQGFEVYLPGLPDHRSGILTIDWPGANHLAARKQCLADNVILSVRGGKLRVSTHAYNNADDIERLLSSLHTFRDSQA